MPYKSLKQEGYFHEHPEKVGGMKVVKEFDRATKGKHLPKKAKKKKMCEGGMVSKMRHGQY
jgi:hypothetical protein